MGASDVRADAPLLVIVRAAAGLDDRTAGAVEAAIQRQDRVIVAVPAGAPGPPHPSAVLRRLRAEVLPVAAAAARAHEHATSGGTTVVLDNGAHGPDKRWLRDLAAAATQAGGAALPATNAAPWPACPTDLPDAAATRNEWRTFARGLAGRPAVAVTDAAQLAGPAVALASAAAAVRADVPDLEPGALAALAAERLPVVRADAAYVHDDRVHLLVSACLIMKDEADNLPRCLRSLAGVVDEIVVYDTGSTDDSVAVARALGATVVEGEWHDDFARARNAARAHCRGAWLLHIDADEEIEHPATARAELAVLARRDLRADVVALPLFNLMGTELAPQRKPTPHRVPRLLRRAGCHWTGALHEHPMPVRGGTPVVAAGPQVVLIHYGYLDEVMQRRNKADRNARIAASLDEDADEGRAHFDRARTHSLNGRLDDALAEYDAAAASAGNPVHRRCALELGATMLLKRHRPDDADPWIARREAIADKPGVARWLRARQALLRDRPADALAALDGITDYNDNFSSNGPDGVHLMRAQAHLALGARDRGADGPAATELLAALSHNPTLDEAWVLLIRGAESWPDAFARAGALVPRDQLKLLAGKLLSVPPPQAALVAEGLWAAHPGAPALLALAVRLAPELDLEDAAHWAVRLRAANLAAHCPLVAVATDPGAPLVRRVQAAYLAAELFADPAMTALQRQLTELLPAS